MLIDVHKKLMAGEKPEPTGMEQEAHQNSGLQFF